MIISNDSVVARDVIDSRAEGRMTSRQLSGERTLKIVKYTILNLSSDLIIIIGGSGKEFKKTQ